MDKKKKIIDLLTKAYEFEQTFVMELTDEQRSNPGSPENWSAKDLIAHNASWKERHSNNIIAVQEGSQPVRVTDFDQENERLFHEHNQKNWDEVLAYAVNVQNKLFGLTEKLSPDSLETYGFLPWQEDRPLWRTIWGYGYSHPLVHISEHFRNRGEMDKAAIVIGMLVDDLEDLDDSPAWKGGLHYNRACQYSLSGRVDGAIAELKQALDLNDGLREWAKVDQDLEAIRNEPDFIALFQE